MIKEGMYITWDGTGEDILVVTSITPSHIHASRVEDVEPYLLHEENCKPFWIQKGDVFSYPRHNNKYTVAEITFEHELKVIFTDGEWDSLRNMSESDKELI